MINQKESKQVSMDFLVAQTSVKRHENKNRKHQPTNNYKKLQKN